MKKILSGFVIVALASLVGCGAPNTTGGNPKDKKEQFSLSAGNLTVEQGETKNVKVTAKRGENFKDKIALEFMDDHKGQDAVEFVDAPKELTTATNEVEVGIKTTDKTAVGEHHITITGKAGSGEPATTKVTVTVKEKKK